MTHNVPCITALLDDFPDCTHPDNTLRQATHGHTCDRCYARIEHAIHTADHLRTALTGAERAITPDTTNSIPGPRLPHTAWQLDLDAINRAQTGHHDADTWVATAAGATDAIRFARTVHTAEQAHPTQDRERKLNRLRCPNCRNKTAIVSPPDWYGDNTTISCIACGWTASNPDALDIVTTIEAQGPIDLLALATRKPGAA